MEFDSWEYARYHMTNFVCRRPNKLIDIHLSLYEENWQNGKEQCRDKRDPSYFEDDNDIGQTIDISQAKSRFEIISTIDRHIVLC